MMRAIEGEGGREAALQNWRSPESALLLIVRPSASRPPFYTNLLGVNSSARSIPLSLTIKTFCAFNRRPMPPPPRRQKQLNKRRRFYQLLLLHLRTDRPEIGRYKSVQLFKSGQIDKRSPESLTRVENCTPAKVSYCRDLKKCTLHLLDLSKLHVLLAKP